MKINNKIKVIATTGFIKKQLFPDAEEL